MCYDHEQQDVSNLLERLEKEKIEAQKEFTKLFKQPENGIPPQIFRKGDVWW